MNTMKKHTLIAILALLGGSTVFAGAATHFTPTAVKKCSNCGCNGRDKSKMCPDEAGKQCSCSKK